MQGPFLLQLQRILSRILSTYQIPPKYCFIQYFFYRPAALYRGLDTHNIFSAVSMQAANRLAIFSFRSHLAHLLLKSIRMIAMQSYSCGCYATSFLNHITYQNPQVVLSCSLLQNSFLRFKTKNRLYISAKTVYIRGSTLLRRQIKQMPSHLNDDNAVSGIS